MILLAFPAFAGAVHEVPEGATTLAVLVCPWNDTCDADEAWVSDVQGVGEAPFVPLELLFERDNGGYSGGVDTRAALARAVDAATAAATKGRWAAVASAITDAKAALAQVHGDVNNETLFDLYFLEGAAARARGKDRGHEYSFREAAAIANGDTPKLPPHDEASERAWLDESRKLMVGGTGTLALTAPTPGTRWSVDGVTLGNGVTELSLLPGNHRVVATVTGSVRSWQGDVPVLAGRTVAITASFAPTDSAQWLQTGVEQAFDTLQAPPEVTALLAEFARRHHLSALRMLRVEEDAPKAAPPAPVLGAPDPMRPAAAEGEKVDHGDGIPATYAEEVLATDTITRDAPPGEPERRLRVMWFDPTLERFSLDGGPALVREDTTEPRFRASLHLGYVGMMQHHHAAADLAGAWRVGPVSLEARLGVVRADYPYNLYTNWTDLQLYHAAVSVRWAPPWTVAPFVSVGPEVYVPVAFGARLSAGAQVRIDRRWVGIVEANGGWLDQGPSWGVGLGLGRTY
jgi:hypothetical protein